MKFFGCFLFLFLAASFSTHFAVSGDSKDKPSRQRCESNLGDTNNVATAPRSTLTPRQYCDTFPQRLGKFDYGKKIGALVRAVSENGIRDKVLRIWLYVKTNDLIEPLREELKDAPVELVFIVDANIDGVAEISKK